MSLNALLSRSHGFMKNRSMFLIRLFQQHDIKEAKNFVVYMWSKAMVHQSIRLNKQDATELADYFVDSYLLNGYSYGLFEKASGKLAGLFLSDLFDLSKERVSTMPEVNKVKPLILEAERQVSSKIPSSGCFYDLILGGVHPDFRRLGVNREINLHAIEIAKYYGCVGVGGPVSSAYAFRVCTKNGFECLWKTKISSFRDPKTGVLLYPNCDPKHEDYYYVYKSLNQNLSKL